MTWLRRHLRGSTLRFAIYALVCLVLLVGLAVRVANIQLFTHRTVYRALMADATGLQPGDEVKLAGVDIGQVKAVTTQRGQALVSFSVDNSLRVPTDTQIGIRWHNVLGQKFLYLYPPRRRGPYLAPGATIPVSQDSADADIGEFLNALGPVLQSIDPAQANAFVQGVLGGLQGNLDQVGSLIDNAATVSDTVGGLQLQVGRVIDNLSTVLGAIGGRSRDLEAVVTNLATISGSLAAQNATLDAVVGNFPKLSGEFATLVSTNRGNLNGIIASLQTVTATLAAHRSDLNADLATLSEGLEPYTLISSYGQWFDVQTVYTCLAQESATSCTYQEGGAKPSQPKQAGPRAQGSGTQGAGASPGIGSLLDRMLGKGP
jgi:phospholipid/cholesterol/gamma-HCH transport system substrate-binding protein